MILVRKKQRILKYQIYDYVSDVIVSKIGSSGFNIGIGITRYRKTKVK